SEALSTDLGPGHVRTLHARAMLARALAEQGLGREALAVAIEVLEAGAGATGPGIEAVVGWVGQAVDRAGAAGDRAGCDPRHRSCADRFIAAGATGREAGKPRVATARYRVAIRLRPAEPRAHAGLLSAGNATLDPVDRNDVAWALVVTPGFEPGDDLT